MTRPAAFCKYHPDRPNYQGKRCKECFDWMNDPTAPCPHDGRKKDGKGRCSSCMSRFYYLRRANGQGDKFKTARVTNGRLALGRDASTPEQLRYLIKRKRQLHAYGLTLDDYDRIFNAQGGRCAICQEPEKDGRDLVVDHDHRCCSTERRCCGKCVRGLLCHGCNMRLGQLESPLVQRSLDYLARYTVLRAAL